MSDNLDERLAHQESTYEFWYRNNFGNHVNERALRVEEAARKYAKFVPSEGSKARHEAFKELVALFADLDSAQPKALQWTCEKHKSTWHWSEWCKDCIRDAMCHESILETKVPEGMLPHVQITMNSQTLPQTAAQVQADLDRAAHHQRWMEAMAAQQSFCTKHSQAYVMTEACPQCMVEDKTE